MQNLFAKKLYLQFCIYYFLNSLQIAVPVLLIYFIKLLFKKTP